jgi:hypothetical protein
VKRHPDIEAVLEVAHRYKVKCFLTMGFPHISGMSNKLLGETYGLEKKEVHPRASDGPVAHNCDPKTRQVWFDHLDPDCVETHLHEVMHVILSPPGHDIDQLSEDVVLMPLERIIAKRIFTKKAYKRVVSWQENTQIEWWDAKLRKYYGSLADVPNYTRWWHWRNSFDGLRRMGVLDGNNNPTWKRPKWSRAPKALIQRGNLI